MPLISIRNVIIMLIGLVAPNDSRALDCMLHVWYSAFITAEDAKLLQEKVLPLIQKVDEEIENNPQPASEVLVKTWIFGQTSCRFELERSLWTCMVSHLMTCAVGKEACFKISAKHAYHDRRSITHAAHREDYVDRHFITLKPSARVCAQRFRDDGLLLPFGADQKSFNIPNPYVLFVTILSFS
jgi:hypothetical protein